jgi:polar amino acid transport system substrate-binding protein
VVIVALAVWLLTRAVLSGRDATWARIQEAGVWRVGMDPSFPPFEDLDPTTKRPVGFDVDLATAIAARWGVRAEIVGVGFDQLIDAVAAHRVDSALSALPIIPYRAKEVSFSAPYFEAGVVLVVPLGSTISKPADLAGRRVAAEWGSEGDAQARILQRQLGGNLTLVLRPSPDAALATVLNGEADAVVTDAVSLALFVRNGPRLIVVGEPLRRDPYVIVTPVDAPRLRKAVDEALAALAADGTLAALKERWLGITGRE